MKLKVIAASALLIVAAAPTSYAGDKGSHNSPQAPARVENQTHQEVHASEAPHPAPSGSLTARPNSSATPRVSESPHPSDSASPTSTPWVDPGFQLALADARAQYLQALATATTQAEKKAAKVQYQQSVRAIKKAQASIK